MKDHAQIRIQNAVNCGAVLKETHGMVRIMEIDEDSWSGYPTVSLVRL
jgi:hypothetical protein